MTLQASSQEGFRLHKDKLKLLLPDKDAKSIDFLLARLDAQIRAFIVENLAASFVDLGARHVNEKIVRYTLFGD